MANKKGVLHPTLEKIKHSILTKGNPYMEKPSHRFKWCRSCEESAEALSRSIPNNSDYEDIKSVDVFSNTDNTSPKIGYFVGCTNAHRSKELANSTCKVLTKLGVNFILFPEELCCGSVLFRTGLEDEAIELVRKNIDIINKTGVEKVVFSCSCCYSTFVHDYARVLGKELKFKPYHLTQFLLKTLNKKGIKLKYENPSSNNSILVTYHDPCHLGRYCDEYDAPRNLLKKIQGLILVEMKHNREMALCCGAGGGVKSLYGEQSEEISGFGLRETRTCMVQMRENRVRKAVETQAEVLITACVFCRNNFYTAAIGANLPIKVRDISQILEQCKFIK
jgi:heterodisulfide reductase subunit D